MSKSKIIFQLLKSITNPKLIKEIIQERKESREDELHKLHNYQYDFSSIEEFFNIEFPKQNVSVYDIELKEIEDHVEKFFDKLKNESYPSTKKPYPINYSINNDSRKFLYILCRILKPKIIVETGVAYGLSSLYILRALEKNNQGKLYSIDSVFRPWQIKDMIGAIIPQELRNNWELILGKSNERLQEVLDQFDGIDVFIHDSSHTYKNMLYEFSTCFEKLNENGLIISDDILDNDAFYDFVSKKKIKNYIIKVVENSGLGIIKRI